MLIYPVSVGFSKFGDLKQIISNSSKIYEKFQVYEVYSWKKFKFSLQYVIFGRIWNLLAVCYFWSKVDLPAARLRNNILQGDFKCLPPGYFINLQLSSSKQNSMQQTQQLKLSFRSNVRTDQEKLQKSQCIEQFSSNHEQCTRQCHSKNYLVAVEIVIVQAILPVSHFYNKIWSSK